MFPYGQTITVYRPGGHDWNGDPIPGSSHEVRGCAIWQNSSLEITQGRDTIVTTRTLVAPPGSDIAATDLVWLPGQNVEQPARWQVNGDPNPIHSPFTGWEPGLEVQLKVVTG